MHLKTAQRELWLRQFHPGPGHGPMLVCFPHAGGAATAFRPLSAALSAHADVWALQYPGRQDRLSETPATRLDELADTISGVLRESAERPLVLYGHSMGAILAYETARRLEATGTGVTLAGLIVSGAQAPVIPRRDGVHLRNDDEVIDEIRRLNGTDPQLLASPEIRRMILPALRGDYEALETYRFTHEAPPLRCPVSALIGVADPHTTEEGAQRWQEITESGFGLRTFPGGHFFPESHRPQVAKALADDINSFAYTVRRTL